MLSRLFPYVHLDVLHILFSCKTLTARTHIHTHSHTHTHTPTTVLLAGHEFLLYGLSPFLKVIVLCTVTSITFRMFWATGLTYHYYLKEAHHFLQLPKVCKQCPPSLPPPAWILTSQNSVDNNNEILFYG